MPILDPNHDHMHPVEGESAWSESYYFNGYDPDADVGLYTRIGIRPNEGRMDVMLASWQPGNKIAFTGAKQDQKEMCESPLEVGDLHRGWIWRDGEHTSLVEWRVRTETDEDAITQKTCFVTAVDKRGREHALRADVMRVFPGGARPGETVVNEGLAKWTYEGVTGYGIAEYLHQFDDDGRPLVPIE